MSYEQKRLTVRVYLPGPPEKVTDWEAVAKEVMAWSLDGRFPTIGDFHAMQQRHTTEHPSRIDTGVDVVIRNDEKDDDGTLRASFVVDGEEQTYLFTSFTDDCKAIAALGFPTDPQKVVETRAEGDGAYTGIREAVKPVVNASASVTEGGGATVSEMPEMVYLHPNKRFILTPAEQYDNLTIPVGEYVRADIVAAEVTRLDDQLTAMLAVDRSKDERIAELEAWKKSATKILNECRFQDVGEEMGVPLGASISAAILPGIRALKAENAKLRESNALLEMLWQGGGMNIFRRMMRRRHEKEAAGLLGIKEIEVRNNTAKFVVDHPALHAVVEQAALIFIEQKAVNYVHIEGTAKGRRFIVTIRPEKWGVLTPEQKAQKAVDLLEMVLNDDDHGTGAFAARQWLAEQATKEVA